MATLNGTGLVISIGGLPIAASTDCELTIEAEGISTAGATQGEVNEAVVGLRGWKITVDGYYLLTRGTVMAQTMIDGNKLDVIAKFGSEKYYGFAYLTDYETSGDAKTKVKSRLTLQGTGALGTLPVVNPSLETGVTYSNYKVAGHEMMLGIDGDQMALLTNTTLSMKRELTETMHANGWRQYSPGRYSWNIEADGYISLITATKDLHGISVGSAVDAVMRIGLDKYSGTAKVISKSESGPLKQKAATHVALTGTSKLSVVNPESSYFDYELSFVF